MDSFDCRVNSGHGEADAWLDSTLGSWHSNGRQSVSVPANRPSAKPQTITLKESVAWFRVGHECSLKLIEGEKFNDWLRLLEQALV